MTYTLNIEKRADSERADALRKAGILPAIIYGPKQESISIKLSQKEFDKVFKKAGESSVIELVGVGETHDALIHDFDLDPVKDVIRHVDFYVIE